MKKMVLFTLSFATIVWAAGPALADAADDAIKARQSFMQVVLFNARPLFGMIQGKAEYDAKQAQMAADNLKALASMNNGAMWPKGSDNTAKKGKTRALPGIWEKGSEIGKISNAWKAAVTELAASAGEGLDKLKPKVAAVSKECSSCHKAYRAKDF